MDTAIFEDNDAEVDDISDIQLGLKKHDSSASLESDAGEDKKSVSRRKRLLRKAPDAPKRFKSAYICYVIEKMDEAKKNLAEDVKVPFSP